MPLGERLGTLLRLVRESVGEAAPFGAPGEGDNDPDEAPDVAGNLKLFIAAVCVGNEPTGRPPVNPRWCELATGRDSRFCEGEEAT